MLLIFGLLIQPQQGQFDFWMARITVFLLWTRTENCGKEFNVFNNRLHQQIIMVVICMCDRCLNQVACIVSILGRLAIRFKMLFGSGDNHSSCISLKFVNLFSGSTTVKCIFKYPSGC